MFAFAPLQIIGELQKTGIYTMHNFPKFLIKSLPQMFKRCRMLPGANPGGECRGRIPPTVI